MDESASDSSQSSPRAYIRAILEKMLPTEAAFIAFCLDYFPLVQRHFSDGMGMVAKHNVLLVHADEAEILAALKVHNARCSNRYSHLFIDNDSEIVAYPTANPYRGLAAFQIEHAHLFFGREALTRKLCEQIQKLYSTAEQLHLLTILGPSGSGKSSLAQAGLLAALQRQSIVGSQAPHIAILRPGERPIESLARSLCSAFPSSAPPASSPDVAALRRLRDALAQASAEGTYDGLRLYAASLPESRERPLVLLIDQFEEIYTLCKFEHERDIFVNLLLDAAASLDAHILVIITLRSDFLGETQRYHLTLNRAIGDHSLIVTGMSQEEVRRVIIQPAQLAGQLIDDATVEVLLNETRDSEGMLPLLEFALTRIWEGLLRGRPAIDALSAIGGVGGALAGQAESIFAALTAREKAICRRALVRLAQLGEGKRDTRRRVAIGDLCGREDKESEVLSVLRAFATEGARLIVLSNETGVTVAEVTHEALFEHWLALRQWIDESRADRRFHDRVELAARLWVEAGKVSGRLWRSPDLDLLQQYSNRRPDELSQQQVAFLLASLRQRSREKLWRAAALLVTAALLLTAMGIYVLKNKQNRAQLALSYVERGREELQKANLSEASLWLQQAYENGASAPELPYLLSQAMRSVDAIQAVLIGHEGYIYSARFSPDGRRVVTGSTDRTARIWDAKTGKLLVRLTDHPAGIRTALFDFDGKRVITLDGEGSLRFWDAYDGSLLFATTGRPGNSISASLSPDGALVATLAFEQPNIGSSQYLSSQTEDYAEEARSSQQRSNWGSARLKNVNATHSYIRLWDAATGKLLREIKEEGISLDSPEWSPDGRSILVVARSPSGTDLPSVARIWDVQSGRLLHSVTSTQAGVQRAHFDPEGGRMVLAWYGGWGTPNGYVQIWDIDRQQLLHTLAGHTGPIDDAQFSPDGRLLVTASFDKTARIWESDSGVLRHELRGHRDGVHAASFSPDGHYVQTTGGDHTVRIWDSDSGGLIAELAGHSAQITHTEFTADSRWLMTSSSDKTVKIWWTDPRRIVAEFGQAEVSPDGQCLLTRSRSDESTCWNTLLGKPIGPVPNANLRFSSDPLLVGAGRENCRIATTKYENSRPNTEVLDISQNKMVAEFVGKPVSLDSGGRRLITRDSDETGTVWSLWDIEAGRRLLQFADKGAATPQDWKLSPSGLMLASLETAGDDWSRFIRLRSTNTGTWIGDLSVANYTGILSISPDDRRLTTNSLFDGGMVLWDVLSGRQVAQIALQTGRTGLVTAFSADSSLLAVANGRTANLFDTESGRAIAVLKGHQEAVLTVSITRDSQFVATTSEDKTVRIWQARSGRLVMQLESPSRPTFASFAPDGQHLLVGRQTERGTTVTVWGIGPERRSASETGRLLRCYLSTKLQNSVAIPATPEPSACETLARSAPVTRWTEPDEEALTHAYSTAEFHRIAAAVRSVSPDPAAQAGQFRDLASRFHEEFHSPVAALWAWREVLRVQPDDPITLANRLESWLAVGRYHAVLHSAPSVLALQTLPGMRTSVAALAWAAAKLSQETASRVEWSERTLQEYSQLQDGEQTGWTFAATRKLLEKSLGIVEEMQIDMLLRILEEPKSKQRLTTLEQLARRGLGAPPGGGASPSPYRAEPTSRPPVLTGSEPPIGQGAGRPGGDSGK